MSAEQQLQHEHAQWLASLASGHIHQQVVGSQDRGGQSDAVPDDDQMAGMAVSVQPIVRLEYEEPLVIPAGPPTPVLPFNLRRRRRERDDNSGEYKLFPSKDRGSKGSDMRRPVRPIDRQKMRPWLKNLLDCGTVFGLNWLKRDDGIFQISWRHASRLGWNLETDGDVFERWARHTGIFKDGDVPEPKRWKANFRCALHSLPDVKELTCPSERKGRNATRTYRFLRPGEVEPPVKRKQRYSIQIPYLYDIQASEDSVSPPPESDERNTDEEQAATASVVVGQQPRTFPHCDHDYAIRSDCTDDEQISSAVLTKHNSGFVLIKSKDAHELEFRLTALENETQLASGKKTAPDSPDASPQRKRKEGKKKSLHLRKGKAGSKVVAKGKQQLKKVKKPNDKEPSPATKVSLKALLSGRKGKAVKVGKTLVKVSATAAKKLATKEGKKAGGLGKGKAKKDSGSSSGPGTPTQSQGLQALLEAASQIDRLDAQTTASATAPTNTKTVSPARVTRRSAAAATAVSAAVAQPIVSATVQTLAAATSASASPALTAPVIFATQPVLTTGAGLPCGTAVLAPLPSGITPQISLAVLQKLLGISGLAPGTVTTVTLPGGINSIPVQVVPSPVMPTKQAAVRHPPAPLAQVAGKKSGDRASVKQLPFSAPALTGPSLPAPAPMLQITPPEAGTSMLKHLLRLTGPAVTPTPSHLVPAAPKVFSTHLTAASPSEVKVEMSTAETEMTTAVTLTQAQQALGSDACLVKTENLESCQMLGEFDLASSQEVSWNETVPKSFPYKRVSASKVYVKAEDGGEVVESSGSSDTGETAMAVSQSLVDMQDNTGKEEHCEVRVTTLQAAFSDSHVPTEPPSEAQSISSSSESRVTVCLQQEASPTETLAVCEETVVVTLPQISLPVGQGQSMSTAPMDLMQFLSLFAAGSNSQVIIKAESAVPCHEVDGSGSLSSYVLVDKSGVPAGGRDDGEPCDAVQESYPGSSADLSGDLADRIMTEAPNPPSESAEESMDITVHGSEEGTQVGVTAANSVEVMPNQFIINEADISSLSADHQGADSFVVDAML